MKATKNIFRKQGRPSGDPLGRILVSATDVVKGFPRARIRSRLFNYNIDGNILKPEHEAWLAGQLAPFLRSIPFHLELRGTASASGDSAYNQRLSEERVLLVKEFLVDHCKIREGQVPGSRMTATGEQTANQAFQEDNFDRAVEIIIAPGVLKPPPPPPPPKPKEKEKPKRQFRTIEVRTAGTTNTKRGPSIPFLSGGNQVLEFYDPETGENVFYEIDGGKASPPIFMTLPENPIIKLPEKGFSACTVPADVTLDDLNGKLAAVGRAGVLQFGKAGLVINGLPGGTVKCEIDQGTTLGIELGGTAGRLKPAPSLSKGKRPHRNRTKGEKPGIFIPPGLRKKPGRFPGQSMSRQ